MTELAARLSVVISGETDKNEDEDDAESESGSKSMSFDDAFTESVRDNALLVSRTRNRRRVPERRIRDRWT